MRLIDLKRLAFSALAASRELLGKFLEPIVTFVVLIDLVVAYFYLLSFTCSLICCNLLLVSYVFLVQPISLKPKWGRISWSLLKIAKNFLQASIQLQVGYCKSSYSFHKIRYI